MSDGLFPKDKLRDGSQEGRRYTGESGNRVLFNIWPSTNKKEKASLILCDI